MAKRVYKSQRGFGIGWNFARSVVFMDASARARSVDINADTHWPRLVAFDVAAASPSVGHQWSFE
eukprot:6174687-Pyramimonas_sp.AAC.1